MTDAFDDDDATYLVLTNDEMQYSLWPQHIAVPSGWTPTGPRGARQVCIDWIDANWSDMRPKSLVIAMEKERSR